MKTPVAVTLIIMGALLVMLPALSDFLYQQNVVTVMSKSGVTSVALAGQMSETYRLGCWFTGTAMVGVAVFCSISRARVSEHAALASQRS